MDRGFSEDDPLAHGRRFQGGSARRGGPMPGSQFFFQRVEDNAFTLKNLRIFLERRRRNRVKARRCAARQGRDRQYSEAK